MLRLTSLGRLELTSDGVLLLPGRRKLLAVLVYLARASRPVTRSQLADLFWPVEDGVRARRSVRQALAELRRAVGDALEERDESLALVKGSLELDAGRLEAAVSAGEYQGAFDLWGGGFLEGAEDTGGEDFRAWLEAERQALRRQFAFAAGKLADEAEGRGAWNAGLAITAKWSEALPYDEPASLRHIRLLALAGRRGEAATRHAAFIERLRAEIGEEPSAEFLRFGAGAAAAQAEDLSRLPAGAALLSPDLLGREAEFALLVGLWEAVNRGEPALALIEGEEGAGKSRLLEEFLRWLSQRVPGPLVLRARAFEAERDRPGVLLRHLLARLPLAPGLIASPPASIAALASLVPEVAERFPSLPARVPADPLGEAVARTLAAIASEAPMIIAVDDAHEADALSREVLESLYRRPPPGVLLVMTALPEQFPALHDLDRRLDAAGLVRIRLAPFSERDVEQVLATMAEFTPSDRHVLAGRLHTESGGIPLAVVEMATALADQGIIAPGPDGVWTLRANLAEGPLPLPASLREATTERLRRLSPEALRVLQAVVVLGRDSEPGVLREVTRLDVAQREAALDQLIGRRFLRASADGSGGLEFTHETMRQAVSLGTPPPRREELHRRAWRAMRRGPARDSSWRAALDYHRGRGRGGVGPWFHDHARALLVGGLAVVLVGLAVRALVRLGPRPSSSTAAVVVPSFAVEGDSSLTFLGRAVAELVARGLNGAAGLRAFEPGLLAGGDTAAPRNRQAAAELARVQDADLFVLGRISGTSAQLVIAAALYDRRHQDRPMVQADAEGPAENAVGLAQEVARQLLAGRAKGDAAAFSPLPSGTTLSLAALRKYLEGERLYRNLEIGEAIAAYRQALRIDTSFAFAWYRIGDAALWWLRTDVARPAADSALYYASSADPGEVDRLRGFRAMVYGQIESAETILRGSLSVHPRRTETQYLLAELLYDFNWLRGRSREEAKSLYLALRREQPGDWRTLPHLWDLAIAEGRLGAADAIRDSLAAITRDADLFDSFDAIRQFAGSDSTIRARLLDSLRPLNQWILANVVRRYATLTHDIEGSRTLTTLLLGPERPSEVRATGHMFLSTLALAQGRMRQAREEAALAKELSPVAAYQWALLMLSPSLPHSGTITTERARIRSSLGAIPSIVIKPPYWPWTDYDLRDAKAIYPYLQARLALALGDTVTAVSWRDSLARVVTSGTQRSAVLFHSLLASLAAGRGARSIALLELDSAASGVPIDLTVMSVFAARPGDRYLAAEVLAAQGRTDDALAWLGGIGEGSLYDLADLGEALLRRGELLERKDDRSGARATYRKLAALWSEADEEFKPMAARAAERLRALGD